MLSSYSKGIKIFFKKMQNVLTTNEKKLIN